MGSPVPQLMTDVAWYAQAGELGLGASRDQGAYAGSAAMLPANEAMDRYADGDDGAFSDLYDAVEPRLRRFVLALTGSEALADDVIQQTFLQMVRCRQYFARGAPVLPWVYAIARNVVRDAARRRASEEHAAAVDETLQASPELLPDEALDNRMRERELGEALAGLPEKLRVAFVLVNVEGLPLQEAAQALGITPNNLKQRAFRARQMLRLAGEGG